MLQVNSPLYFSFQDNYVVRMDNNFIIYMFLFQDCCPGNGMLKLFIIVESVYWLRDIYVRIVICYYLLFHH